MKHTVLFLITMSLLAGCHSEAPQRDIKAKSKFESTPLSVSLADLKEVDPQTLSSANWTRKSCALSTPEVPETQKEITLESSGLIRLAGYFIDPTDQPAGQFNVALVGEKKAFVFPARTGWDRTDVAEYFEKQQLETSGFDVNVDLKSLPAGSYKINYLVDRKGGTFFCESGKILVKAELNSGEGAPVEADKATPAGAGNSN